MAEWTIYNRQPHNRSTKVKDTTITQWPPPPPPPPQPLPGSSSLLIPLCISILAQRWCVHWWVLAFTLFYHHEINSHLFVFILTCGSVWQGGRKIIDEVEWGRAISVVQIIWGSLSSFSLESRNIVCNMWLLNSKASNNVQAMQEWGVWSIWAVSLFTIIYNRLRNTQNI